MISDGNNSYLYDAEDRMTPNGGGGTVYTYDGDGHRVKTVTGGPTTTLFWFDDNFEPVSVGDGTGAIARDYVFFGGKRIGFTSLTTGATHYYWTDHLGSPREITSGSGANVEWEADYYPFGGKRVINNSLDTSYMFTGWQIDYELTFGIQYYYHPGFREQATWTGRFLSPDPAGLAAVDASNPQSWNSYAYVLNNPSTYTDPLGLDCQGASTSHLAPGAGGPGAIVVNVSKPCPSDQGQPTRNWWDILGPLPFSVHIIRPYVTLAEWDDLHPRFDHSVKAANNGGSTSKVSVGYTVNLIGSIFYGLGPAFTYTKLPSLNLTCVGGGIGASARHNFSFGPTVVSTQSAKDILSGWSVSGGYNATPLTGAGGSGNSSGTAGGNTFGIPGASASLTWSKCW